MNSKSTTITVTPLDGAQGVIGFETNVFGHIAQQVASLQDDVVRQQLIAAGWMPPAASAHTRALENVALLADILNRRPAMNAGLLEAYAHWTSEVYDLMGAMSAAAPKAAPQPAAQQGPVAWLHDDPKRFDVIHAEVKDLLVKSRDAAGYLHRPLDKSEHYTIPLYAQPQEEAPVAQGDESEREAFEAWIKKDCGDLSTFGSGQNIHYRNSAVNNAWTGWKARAGAAPVAQGDAEAELAYQAACSLAKSLFKKHFAHQPEYASGEMKWDVCDTTAGVISQIDNMVCGFALEDAGDAARYRWLRAGVRERQGIPVSGHRTISSSSLRAMMEFNFWCTPDELDAAIDAARAQQEGQNNG